MSSGGGSAAKAPKAAMGLDLQSSQYGACLPVLFGQNKVAGTVGYYSEFKAVKHKEKQQGGKGGGSQSTVSYTYSATFQLILIEGPGTVVNVLNGTSTQSLASLGGIASAGTIGQAPWAHLSGLAAIGYSGSVVVSFQDYQLGDNPSLPNLNFEMVGRNQYNTTVKDANPADILTTICTDSIIGVKFTALGDMTQFSNYCRAAGLFFSPLYDQQMQASAPIEDLMKYANSAAFFSEGVVKVVPYGDSVITGNGVTYTPNLTAVADLTANDFITNGTDDPVKAHRKAPADSRNLHRIEFKDRANNYHTNAVQASIDQDVNDAGARSDDSDSVDMITSITTARLVAQNLLQRDFYVRNTYEFQLSWRYCYLEPMDIVTLTDANTGLNLTPVRITEVNEDEDGLLSIVAEEMPDGIGHGGSYGTQTNGHVPVDPNTDPGPIDAPYIFRAPGFLVSPGAPQMWCAISGSGQYWAGCKVYISSDNTSFEYLTSFARESSYGYLTNAITAGTDLDSTNLPNVVLNGGAQLRGGNATDRDNFVTMSMIDTEVISYRTATLAAGPSYTLGSLRRGGYGTTMAAHAINAPFVRLDDNLLKLPIDASQIGTTVYLKFVSFNCFGLGGRTLASETSYPYVIGTNVEFPDKPVTPTSFTVIPVADGVNLKWVNDNPAAVASTSIEFGTSSTGPWTVLGQVGPTHTSYHHAFATGATFWYRIRSRGHQVSGGWSAYSPILSSTGVNVGTIANNASAALAQANATATDVANIASDNVLSVVEKKRIIADYAVVTGEKAGIDAQAAVYDVGAELTDYDAKYTTLINYMATLTSPVLWSNLTNYTTLTSGVTFRNNWANYLQAKVVLLQKIADLAMYGDDYVGNENLLPNPQFLSNKVGAGTNVVIPTGSAVRDGWIVNNQLGTAESQMYWDGTGVHMQMNGATAVANGASREVRGGTAKIYVQAGKTYEFGLDQAAVSFNGAPAASVNIWTQMTARWFNAAGTSLSYVEAFHLLRNFTGSGYGTLVAPAGAVYVIVELRGLIQNLSGASFDIVSAGGSVAYNIRVTSAFMRRLDDLAVAGSGYQLGDLRNMAMVRVGSTGSRWSGAAITYSIPTTGAPAVITFTVAAGSLQCGSVAVSYAASSGTASQARSTTVTYYFYYVDPKYTGGTLTLNVTTNAANLSNADDRVWIGDATVTTPVLGTGGSGGGGAGGGCVDGAMWIDQETQAEDVKSGKLLDIVDESSSRPKKRKYRATAHTMRIVNCWRIVTESGAAVVAGETTPMTLKNGKCILIPEMLGEQALVDHCGTLVWETVVGCYPFGKRPVHHISVGGNSYFAGVDPNHRIATHNSLKP